MSKSVLYSCSQGVLETKVDEEIVLMNLNGGIYYGLDEVASRVWGILSAKPMTLDTLCEVLIAEYKVDRLSCQEDTRSFLGTLIERGLVKEEAAQ